MSTIFYLTQEWASVKNSRWPGVRRSDIRRGLKVTQHPQTEPVDLATAYLQCKVPTSGSPATSPDDDILNIFIPAAREACENYAGLSLAPQSLSLVLDRFPDTYDLQSIELPFGPLQTIDSVQYVDTADATQTLDSSIYYIDSFSSRIVLADSQTWPATRIHPTAVTIDYVAGYQTPSTSPSEPQLPASLRAAILLTLSHIYDACQNGDICDIGDLPAAAKYLLDPYRVRSSFA